MIRGFAVFIAMILGTMANTNAQAPVDSAPAASQAAAAPEQAAAPAAAADSNNKTYIVPAGTRILLTLKNEINTKVAQPGDPVYFTSDFPVVAGGMVVLPAGMYVKGVVDSVQRPGKVKGRAALQMHFTSLIFPNGVAINLPGTIDKVPGSTDAKVTNSEGKIEQSGSQGKDAKTVASTTMAGAGVGSIVGGGTGHAVEGLGVGAGAGAAAGLIGTLFTRGNDIVFPQGTTLEMTLDRPVSVQQQQLTGMPNQTGMR